ncbi:MAG: hypothetical protein AAB887_01105, partial [Patescibacteria group bacterium]
MRLKCSIFNIRSSVFYVILFLLITGYRIMITTTPSAKAACWCNDPKKDLCRCQKTGTSPFPAQFQGIQMYCDTEEETFAYDTLKSPICGTSPEIIPWCAYGIDGNQNFWVCYGANFAQGVSSLPTPPIKGQIETQTSGPFTFNGQSFGSSGINTVKVCSDNVFCCGSDNSCSQTGVPPKPNDCSPSLPSVTPPYGFCTNIARSGAGESRLWFPQLRNISALSTLLQSIFNPSPSSFNKNAEPPAPQSAALDNPAAVTTRITLHQGKDDDTPIVNQSDNNSSLRVDQPAPDPLYSFNDPSLPYKASGFCSIADTRANPGDDLLGPTITARLIYTQKYQYQAAPSLNCFGDGAYVSEEDRKNCCSFKAAGIVAPQDGYFSDPKFQEKRYRCGTLPGVREKTQGRIAVFTKTPLIEYIYNTLVVGPQSVIKRLFPLGNPKEFKEITSTANYSAQAPDADQLVVGGQAGVTPTIYFPHIGSLYEYFLQGLQKALRPLGGTFSSVPPPLLGDCNTVAAATTSAPACPSGSSLPFSYACNINSELKTITQEAGGAYGVPPAIIAGILSIETRNGVFGVSKDEVTLHNTYGAYTPYLCQPNACGAMGAMQLLTGYGVQSSCSQATGINNWATYSCKSESENPNPGNLRDTIFAGAKMIKTISGTTPAQNSNWSQDVVIQVAEGYYGSCSESFNLKT